MMFKGDGQVLACGLVKNLVCRGNKLSVGVQVSCEVNQIGHVKWRERGICRHLRAYNFLLYSQTVHMISTPHRVSTMYGPLFAYHMVQLHIEFPSCSTKQLTRLSKRLKEEKLKLRHL